MKITEEMVEAAAKAHTPQFDRMSSDIQEYALIQMRSALEAALAAAPASAEPVSAEGSPLLEWAVSKWNDEVKHRPLVNVHRRSLDDTWRQVIRWAGGDPVMLVGPAHDDLLSTKAE